MRVKELVIYIQRMLGDSAAAERQHLERFDLETLFEFTAILKRNDCDDSVLLLAC